jgi:hypothetical protein
LSLAATTSEVDVAWVEIAATVPTQDLHFARLRPDFTVLSDTRCFGPADASGVGIAPLGNGWVVGTLTGSDTNVGGGLYLQRIDSTGHLLGSRTIATDDKSPFEFRLTAGPNGSALATWLEGSPNSSVGNLHAELVSADGSSAWTAVNVGTNVESWSAITTGDGFLVAAEWDPGLGASPLTASRSIQLLRLGIDGSLSSGGNIPVVDPTTVYLLWSGTQGRLWYTPNSGSTDASQVQTLAKDGTLIGSPAGVELPSAQGAEALVAVGASDALVLTLAGGTQYLARLGATGLPVWPEVTAARAVGNGLDMVLQNGDAIVAWGDGTALSFERIRVSP